MRLLEQAEEPILERLVARLDRVDLPAALDDRADELGDAKGGDAANDEPLALVRQLAERAEPVEIGRASCRERV